MRPGNTEWHPSKNLNDWGGVYTTGTKVEVVDAGDGWWKEVGKNSYIKKGCLTATKGACCSAASCPG